MENALVEDSVGWLTMRQKPESIWLRSGIKKAAIKKALLNIKKNSFRKDRSDSCLRRFKQRTSDVCGISSIIPQTAANVQYFQQKTGRQKATGQWLAGLLFGRVLNGCGSYIQCDGLCGWDFGCLLFRTELMIVDQVQRNSHKEHTAHDIAQCYGNQIVDQEIAPGELCQQQF